METIKEIVTMYLKKIPKKLLKDFEEGGKKNLYFIVEDFYKTVNDKECKKYKPQMVIPILQKKLKQKKIPKGPYCQICGDWVGIWACSCEGGTF